MQTQLISCFTYETECGPLTIGCCDNRVKSVHFGAFPSKLSDPQARQTADEAFRQIREYLSGVRRTFGLSLEPEGTAFQREVWDALCSIPYGETRTYGQIAAQIGRPRASRAVGMANHKNPISILIPCHRVIGANGSLTGYAGGLEIKKQLLALEHTTKHNF